MPSFPVLKCGASLQHPAQRSLAYDTHVTRFLNGAEQRFRNRGAARRTWKSTLTLIDSVESRQLVDLFRERQGEFGAFTFIDPWDGTPYTDARFADAAIAARQDDETRFSVAVTIESNEG